MSDGIFCVIGKLSWTSTVVTFRSKDPEESVIGFFFRENVNGKILSSIFLSFFSVSKASNLEGGMSLMSAIILLRTSRFFLSLYNHNRLISHIQFQCFKARFQNSIPETWKQNPTPPSRCLLNFFSLIFVFLFQEFDLIRKMLFKRDIVSKQKGLNPCFIFYEHFFESMLVLF